MLSQNYFTLFNLPEAFLVDEQLLASRYRQLQKQFHPDKFAGHTEQEQRLAVQMASYVNQAYDCLRSALKRAGYLLQLRGIDGNLEQMTTSDHQFLNQQMLWREELMDLHLQDNTEVSLQLLRGKVDSFAAGVEAQFASHYAVENYAEALQDVAKLHFVCKLQADIHRYEDQLFNEY